MLPPAPLAVHGSSCSAEHSSCVGDPGLGDLCSSGPCHPVYVSLLLRLALREESRIWWGESQVQSESTPQRPHKGTKVLRVSGPKLCLRITNSQTNPGCWCPGPSVCPTWWPASPVLQRILEPDPELGIQLVDEAPAVQTAVPQWSGMLCLAQCWRVSKQQRVTELLVHSTHERMRGSR